MRNHFWKRGNERIGRKKTEMTAVSQVKEIRKFAGDFEGGVEDGGGEAVVISSKVRERKLLKNAMGVKDQRFVDIHFILDW